jgi:hypothetical protein
MAGGYPHHVHRLKTVNNVTYGEWRGASHSVIFGVHPDSTKQKPIHYRRIICQPAVAFTFAAIKWPDRIARSLAWDPQPEPKQRERVPFSVPFEVRIQRYVAAIPGAKSGHGGHTQTFKVAEALTRGFDRSIEQALPHMRAYNERCDERWTEKELLHKLKSAQEQGRMEKGYLL